MSDEEIDEMIKLHGNSGDALVSFEDFKAMIMEADEKAPAAFQLGAE